MVEVGENIKKLRKIRDWTQKDLADRAGLNHASVSNIENGAKGVSLDKLDKIARALDVSIINLFLDEDEINRFKYNDDIKTWFPGSDRVNEILNQLLENNVAWSKTKRIAIIDLDNVKGDTDND